MHGKGLENTRDLWRTISDRAPQAGCRDTCYYKLTRRRKWIEKESLGSTSIVKLCNGFYSVQVGHACQLIQDSPCSSSLSSSFPSRQWGRKEATKFKKKIELRSNRFKIQPIESIENLETQISKFKKIKLPVLIFDFLD